MEITQYNLEYLCKGAAFLGSGGGGSTKSKHDIVLRLIKENGPIPLSSIEELPNNGVVLGIECIGAPVPESQTKNIEAYDLEPLLKVVQNDLGVHVSAIMPVEIGGGNSLTPLCVAHQLSTPVLDGDLLGRAFPEIPMVSLSLFNMFPKRTYISSVEGTAIEILNCKNYEELESRARAHAIKHTNYTSVLVSAILTLDEIKKVVIPKTISRCIEIGQQNTLDSLVKVVNGKIVTQGKVTAVDLRLVNGFLAGIITVKQGSDTFNILVKNEYLKVIFNKHVVAKCPDIISIFDVVDMNIIQSCQIQPGQNVAVIAAPGPNIWYSDAGLDLVGNIL